MKVSSVINFPVERSIVFVDVVCALRPSNSRARLHDLVANVVWAWRRYRLSKKTQTHRAIRDAVQYVDDQSEC